MTYFKLSIPKLNESIDQYRNQKKHVLEDVSFVYKSLGYVDSSWNDSNSASFVNKLKQDKYQLSEYFSYLDTLYSEIGLFKNGIEDICHKYGYKRNNLELKFDDTEITDIKKYLTDSISLLNDSLNRINVYSFPQDFESINVVYTLRSELKNMKTVIKTLSDNITLMDKSIRNELNDSRYRLNKKINHNYKFTTIEYNWKTRVDKLKSYSLSDISQDYVMGTNSVNLGISDKVGDLQKQNLIYNSAESNVKDLNKESTNLSGPSNNYMGSDNSFEYETKLKMDDFNSSVNKTYTTSSDSVEKSQYNFNAFDGNVKYSANDETLNIKSSNVDNIKNSRDYKVSDNTINYTGEEKINFNNVEEYNSASNSVNLNNNANINFNVGNTDYSINNKNVNINTNLNQ